MIGARSGSVNLDRANRYMPNFYSASEAAARLGVSKQTLYSYVSRGLLRAHATERSRERRYLVDEVVQLERKRAHIRKPGEVAKDALDWGLPVVESSICLIANSRLHYRGVNVQTLLASASVEDVAALLWDVPVRSAFTSQAPAFANDFRQAVIRFKRSPPDESLLPLFVNATRGTHEREAARAERRYGELVRTVAGCLLRRSPRATPLHEQCAHVWNLNARQADLVRQALILCADHELNASSFVVRCIASTDASLHACVLGGLAALSGARHGGTTHRIEALWDEIVTRRHPEPLVRARSERGKDLPGFGHPLYPEGDVRATALLSAMSGRRAGWQPYVEAVEEVTGLRPTIDFALVALRRFLQIPEGNAFGLFALGRSIGWIAHALEERHRCRLIRPRAAYVGRPPVVPK
jgi:citrate synthase